MSLEDFTYPIGRFAPPAHVDARERDALVARIATAPEALRNAVARLDDRQLDTPYRPGGWTVRQVVHHLPDSHMNAYVRFKLAITEAEPTIRPYEESLWAQVPEAKLGPVDLSLDLLDALHRRWVAAIRSLPPDAFQRTFRHPDLGVMTLNHQLALYAWHGRHHIAQITNLATREAWV